MTRPPRRGRFPDRNPSDASVEQAYDDVVARFAGRRGVTVPGQDGHRGFGSATLKVHGSIFAMLVSDRFVVKLPADRVAALIDADDGEAFHAGKGRPMREWVVISDRDRRRWQSLAEEAFQFVSTKARP